MEPDDASRPSHENDGLEAEKLSAPMLVPLELLEDCKINFLDFLNNPQAYKRQPVVLTRRQELARRVKDARRRIAALAYRRISGEEVPEERDPYDD